jgi:hypothetical protein
LRNAVLRGAQLGGADLTQADLLGADMKGADFSLAGTAAVKPDEDDHSGQQAADATLQAVNKAIDELFAIRQPLAGQSEPSAQPEEKSVLVAPPEPAADAQSSRRNVDEIPVIKYENLLLETGGEQKKSVSPPPN